MNAGPSSVRRQNASKYPARTGGSHPSHYQPHKSSHRHLPARASEQLRLKDSDSHRRTASVLASKVVGGEDGRKRRYEDSFAKEKSSEPSNKGRKGLPHPSRDGSTVPYRPSVSRGVELAAPQNSDSQVTLSDSLLAPLRAKQGSFSPEFARERPFRLNLTKKNAGLDKGKGKVYDHPLPNHEASSETETGSSAKKSLKFDDPDPSSRIPLTPIPVASLTLEPQTEKRKSWYEQTVEEEEEQARLLDAGPDTILAAKFSQAVNFSSPDGTQPPRSAILLRSGLDHEWVGGEPPLSEALNLDWTAEDDAAYHALEPDMGLETLALDDDDLLGEELEDSFQGGPISVAQATSGQPQRLVPEKSPNSQPTMAEEPEDGKSQMATKDGNSRPGPRTKKESKKKKTEAHHRRAQNISGRAHSTSGPMINLASRKIQNVKGRSPSKRLASKAGTSRPGSSRRAASVPRNGVFPSSKNKSTVVSGGVVGSPIPPATNP